MALRPPATCSIVVELSQPQLQSYSSTSTPSFLSLSLLCADTTATRSTGACGWSSTVCSASWGSSSVGSLSSTSSFGNSKRDTRDGCPILEAICHPFLFLRSRTCAFSYSGNLIFLYNFRVWSQMVFDSTKSINKQGRPQKFVSGGIQFSNDDDDDVLAWK